MIRSIFLPDHRIPSGGTRCPRAVRSDASAGTRAVSPKDSLSACSKIAGFVRPSTGLRLAARLVATGKLPDEDLALLVIEKKLPVAPLAADEEVSVGDDVVVIGAPYGRALSVSSGIVSQLETE